MNTSFCFSSYEGENIVNMLLIIISEMEINILFYTNVELKTSISQLV
jgi:hypothetical protein